MTQGLYTIENDHLSVSVSELGAEMRRIALKPDGQPLLWEGDPAVWRSSAPWLFPVIGKLKDDYYVYQDVRYKAPMHGFTGRSRFEVESQTAESLRFVLRDSPATLAVFPWHFVLSIEYSLSGSRLDIRCTVKNTDEKTMYYSLGAHPGFVCREGDELVFEGQESLTYHHLATGLHLLQHEQGSLPLNDGALKLTSSLFDNDALVLENPAVSQITVRRAEGPSVRFSYDAVPWLGLWSRSGMDLQYVCLEPWFGVDDIVDADHLIEHKVGIQSLAPGAEKIFSLGVEPV